MRVFFPKKIWASLIMTEGCLKTESPNQIIFKRENQSKMHYQCAIVRHYTTGSELERAKERCQPVWRPHAPVEHNTNCNHYNLFNV